MRLSSPTLKVMVWCTSKVSNGFARSGRYIQFKYLQRYDLNGFGLLNWNKNYTFPKPIICEWDFIGRWKNPITFYSLRSYLTYCVFWQNLFRRIVSINKTVFVAFQYHSRRIHVLLLMRSKLDIVGRNSPSTFLEFLNYITKIIFVYKLLYFLVILIFWWLWFITHLNHANGK